MSGTRLALSSLLLAAATVAAVWCSSQLFPLSASPQQVTTTPGVVSKNYSFRRSVSAAGSVDISPNHTNKTRNSLQSSAVVVHGRTYTRRRTYTDPLA